jgi:hypothetical protein
MVASPEARLPPHHARYRNNATQITRPAQGQQKIFPRQRPGILPKGFPGNMLGAKISQIKFNSLNLLGECVAGIET